MIRVLLVDDHEMVRLGVSSYLSIQSDVEVVGKLKTARKAMKRRWTFDPM